MIRFSLITVTFRAGHTFRRTAESVASQTHPWVEHIIIDGGSPDGTLTAISEYEARNRKSGSQHTVVWVSEPDNGIYDAMNKGLAMATGHYVCFLNSGDRLAADTTLADIAAKVEATGLGEQQWPAVVYGDTDIVDDDGNYLGHRHLTPPEHLTWRSFKNGMLVCHQAFYARLDIAKSLPYDLKYRFSADVDWCIRIMRKADRMHLPMLNMQAVVAHYLNEGETTRHHRDSLKERYKVMCKHYGYTTTAFRHVWFAIRALVRKIKGKNY